MKEEWKTVTVDGEVFEGYEVSNMGNVRSLNYGGRTGVVKVLRFKVAGRYLQVCLSKNGKRKMCYVHRIVAYAFLSNDDPKNKTQINHLDENPRNNHVSNLEWTTPKQNANHGTRNERAAKTRGKKVRCVETGEVFESIIEAERKLGLTQGSICQCCRGKLKTCGKFHWEYV